MPCSPLVLAVLSPCKRDQAGTPLLEGSADRLQIVFFVGLWKVEDLLALALECLDGLGEQIGLQIEDFASLPAPENRHRADLVFGKASLLCELLECRGGGPARANKLRVGQCTPCRIALGRQSNQKHRGEHWF